MKKGERRSEFLLMSCHDRDSLHVPRPQINYLSKQRIKQHE